MFRPCAVTLNGYDKLADRSKAQLTKEEQFQERLLNT